MLLFHIFKKIASYLLLALGYTGFEVKINMRRRKHTHKRPVLKIIFISLLIAMLVVLLAVTSFGAYVYYHMDYTIDEELFELAQGSKTTTIYYNTAGEMDDDPLKKKSRNMTPTYAHLPAGYEPKELEDQRICGAENGIWCAYDDVPQDLKDALVAIEDRHFFSHNGIDWLRTIKAAANYLLHFDSRFGGSTITQQLVKNISSDSDVTISRKIREICRAIHLEKSHSKEEILELYLNVIPLSRGCVGVGAASQLYYGKQPRELTLAECATIAAITNSPARYDPISQAENNRARRDLILERMYSFGMIDEEEYREACATEIHARENNAPSALIYSWYTETVIADVVHDLMEEYGYSKDVAEKMLYSGGLKIYTQMDPHVQIALENYFENKSNFSKILRGNARVSMVVIDPHTGDLLGIIGGIGKKQENRIFNYATQAIRAPGSAIKPLSVYAPALEEGVITWASVLDDVPISLEENAGGYTMWPHNSPMVYSGLTDVRAAVAHSKNTVAVRVLEKLGKEKSFHYLSHRLGLHTLVRSRTTGEGSKVTDIAPAPLALGQLTDGVSVRALTNAYGALANGGMYRECRSYSVVLDRKGKVLLDNKPIASRVFSKETAAIMTELLRGVTEYGTAKDIALTHIVDTVGKTGTSGNAYDKWFVGYTPYMAAGIWCGYENGVTSVPGNMANAHLSIWDDVMQSLHGRYIEEGEPKNFEIPANVVRRAYCRDSGLVPTNACRMDARGDRTVIGYFKIGDEPKGICNCHVLVDYDIEGGGVARDSCPADAVKQIGMIQIPARNFPVDLYVEDAQYVYDPFVYLDLEIGDHAKHHSENKIDASTKAPFNQMCPIHGGAYEDVVEGNRKDPFLWFRKYFLKFGR